MHDRTENAGCDIRDYYVLLMFLLVTFYTLLLILITIPFMLYSAIECFF